MGVTKYAGPEVVMEAAAAGLHHVGENRVQEAARKFPALRESFPQVTRHMIGHLQTNKVRAALDLFDIIQSVDSAHLLETVERSAASQAREVEVLLQVNTSGEPQKYGIAPTGLRSLVEAALRCPHVRVSGLMTVAPWIEDEERVRACFRTLRRLKERTAVEFRGEARVSMRWLSMGMTDDYPLAIEEGANLLRIGRALFAPEDGEGR